MSESTINSIPTESTTICEHCGKKLKADAQFCSSCGRPINITATKKFCARCGTELNDEEMFCHNCGSPTSQSRDAEVMNNIAAYNNSIGKPKKTASIVNIKDNSIWSFIAWMLTALFTALLASRLPIKIAYWSGYSLGLMLFDLALIGFAVSTVSGILFWKNDKKLRLMPVVASLVATLCFFVWGFSYRLELLVSALLMHIIAILFAVKVIKTKSVLLITSISAITLSFLIPVMIGASGFALLSLGLQIPMFLLTFSFTKKELKEIPKKKQVLRNLLAFVLVVLIVLGGVGLGLYQVGFM